MESILQSTVQRHRRRLQSTTGQVCNNLFDCFGALNCCPGFSLDGKGLCYPVCDQDQFKQQCGPTNGCQNGLLCCNHRCYTNAEYTQSSCYVQAAQNY